MAESIEKLTESEETKYVSFSVGSESFGIPIDEVRRIIRMPRVTRVPKTPDFILGISNQRGSVLPIIDLSLRLGYGKPCNVTDEARVIVLEKSGTMTGFVVESVSEVRGVEKQNTENFPEMLDAGIDERFISGLLKMTNGGESRLIQVLNTDEVININELRKNLKESGGQSAGRGGVFEEENDGDDERRFISFQIGIQEYAVEIHMINEIIRVPDYVTVPGVADYVIGIFSLRDSVNPLISLHSKFGRSLPDVNEDTRVVIVDIEDTKIAFMADKVSEVISVPESQIEPPPRVFTDGKESEISSVIKGESGDRLVLILDTGNILADQELAALRQLAEKGEEKLEVQEMDEEIISDEKQIVTFNIEEEEYGIYIEKVQEINRFTNVTRVPKTPPFVEGIINLRGDVIPLIDLRKRFDLEPKERDEFTRVIIVNLDSVKVGFVVDYVDEVLRVSESSIDNVPAVLSSTVDNQFLDGVVNYKAKDTERMIMLLSVDDLFSKAEKKKLENLKDD
ncbi:chemotaxis protein CheW [Limisalsivibrio acetivorans]|uniref:chemotaxis protein CheW n=1 Tax=Limisalsivibrio acetivorans TaxID=1304888 RepID=UPI0003B3CFA2|nr:chemotaxis protein CheW [Limisalsivibrio acetivorans]